MARPGYAHELPSASQPYVSFLGLFSVDLTSPCVTRGGIASQSSFPKNVNSVQEQVLCPSIVSGHILHGAPKA